MLIVRCIDQLHINPNIVTVTLDATFQNSAYTKLSTNIQHALYCIPVAFR